MTCFHQMTTQSKQVIKLGTELNGFLVLDNFSNAKAFEQSDVKKLARLREHAVSAIAKAQLLETLKEKNSELHAAYAQLEQVSLTDQLTGLNNRRFLMKHLDKDIAHVLRQHQDWNDKKVTAPPEESDLIFFIVDLDHFKQVNDVYGHSAGDAVLVDIKEILQQVFRESDFLIRWGGEEFLVIARFIGRNSAAQLAERLRQAFDSHAFDIGDGKVLHKTCSIGFPSFPFIRNDPAVLEWSRVVDVADHCLYSAKKSSRNAWVGIESTDTCSSDNLLQRITAQTAELIHFNELQMLTSISEEKKIEWE